MSKVWFITGAGSGIGAGTAKAALKAGDRVVATGRNVQKVRDALREVASDDLHVLPLDVSDEAQVTMAVDQAVKKFGRIDVVLNTAGYSLLGNFEELGTQEIERQFATNFWGVLYVMRATLPVMRKQRSGHIINMSSVAGVVGLKLQRVQSEQIRRRGALTIRGRGNREVRHQGHGRGAGILPHGPAGRD